MNYHCGILEGAPKWDPFEVLILAHTPGIPIEWIYAGLGLTQRRRKALRDMVTNSHNTDLPEAGQFNAASVVQGDGWAMLRAVCPGYAGAAPLWSRIELQNDTRSNAAIAADLGVDWQKVRRWQKNAVFCPLTGSRIVPNRGTAAG